MISHPETPKASQAAALPQPQPQPQPPPSYNNYQDYPQVRPYSVVPVVRPRQSPGRRFLKAFFVAIFVWLLLSLLVRSTAAALRWSLHGHDWEYRWPTVKGITIGECITGDEWTPVDGRTSGWPYQAETSFDLPISSETLFLLSRGHNSGGLVEVVTSDDQATDLITVHIDIFYRNQEATESTKACLLTRKSEENGVGVFTPEWDRDHQNRIPNVYFHMKFIVPVLDLKPVVINNFETDIPNGRHEFADLVDRILFNSANVKGTNGGIRVKSVSVTHGDFTTSNGGIDGTFNTTKGLKLRSSNGSIRIDAGLQYVDETPKLEARTTNGLVSASISLLAESESGRSFDVITSTSNGRLNVDFPASPLDSTLKYSGRTSNGPATVSLHPAYEGKFTLKSSLLKAKVDQRPNVEDPSGNHRRRKITFSSAPRTNLLQGEVSWGGELKGSVSVQTSNAPLTLEL